MKPFSSSRRDFFTVLLGLVVTCSAQAAPALDETHASVRAVLALQKDVTPGFMQLEGMLGTAVGVSESGEASLMVFVDSESGNRGAVMQSLPPRLRGIAVDVHVTDKFVAFAKAAAAPTAINYKAKQTPPIQLGTSGGWGLDLANGYCCGGTFGSLIQVNGVQYILSNYHVLEADIVSGGNSRVATIGDPVIQPGLIDVNCNAAGAQAVGTLVPISSLPGSNVDCAIAQANAGMVRTDGSILGIGVINAQTATAALNKPVKKSGRTSGLTKSRITGLNATIQISYDNECAGGAAFTKVFTGQLVIANKGSAFLKGGDSGSLMVEDVATKPKAVGLLYAGSSTTAIANPIGEVLTFIGGKLGGTASMVGTP